MPDHLKSPDLIPAHGGYRDLKSYQMSEIIYDATVAFCNRYISRRSRTHDQMVQAARSGKQNIAEGSMASGTSKKTELKLMGVARASLEELLLDYQDHLRQHSLLLWGKDHPGAKEVRGLCYGPDRSYSTNKTYIENSPPETAATRLSASSTRQTTCSTFSFKRLKKLFWRKAGLPRGFTGRGWRREAKFGGQKAEVGGRKKSIE